MTDNSDRPDYHDSLHPRPLHCRPRHEKYGYHPDIHSQYAAEEHIQWTNVGLPVTLTTTGNVSLGTSTETFDEYKRRKLEEKHAECKPPKQEKKNMKRIVRLIAVDPWAPSEYYPIVYDKEVFTRLPPDKAWAQANLVDALATYNADIANASTEDDPHQAEIADLQLKEVVVAEFDTGLLG